jgi:hypothetical protein
MSWLFSQVLVEEYLGDTSLDGEQSVQSSGNPIPQAYCAPDKMKAFSRLSQFGMTFAPLTDIHGEGLSMSSVVDFHVRTLVQQERGQVLTEKEVECGEKWRGSFVKYDQDSSLWRTHQCSLLGDLEPFSEIWPQWGLMRNGECWEQTTLAQTIKGTESGSEQNKWATPTTMDKMPPKSAQALHKEATQARPGRSKPANLRDQVSNMKNWPTPATKGYGHAAEGMVGNLIEKIQQGVITKLEAEQMLSLPKLENHRTWKKKFPTPQLSDYKDRGNMSNPSIQRRAEKGKQMTLSMVAHPTSGQLNPMWVEWLMGWPLGWTDLKPLEMDKSLFVPPPHGGS